MSGAAADLGFLVLQVKVDADAAARFERDVEGEPGLHGEDLEESWHAANAFIVQIGDRVVPVVVHRGSRTEREAVADEQDASAVRGVNDQTAREDQAGDERERTLESSDFQLNCVDSVAC